MLSHNNTIITFDKTYGCTATDSAVQVEERLRVGRDIFHNLIAGVQSVIMIMYNVKQYSNDLTIIVDVYHDVSPNTWCELLIVR